jgi:hypothetical protein
MTAAPRLASSWAIARPIPRLPPVTTATLSVRVVMNEYLLEQKGICIQSYDAIFHVTRS